MAMIYQAREIAKPNGDPSGRWRYVGLSDESRHTVDECCQCDGGHASAEEAEACPVAKARADKIFHRDVESLEHRVSSLKSDLTSAEAELSAKRSTS